MILISFEEERKEELTSLKKIKMKTKYKVRKKTAKQKEKDNILLSVRKWVRKEGTINERNGTQPKTRTKLST